MKFNEFKEEVVEGLKTMFPNNINVQLENVKRNNNTEVVGILIKSDDSPIAPIVYMETYYDCYKKGMKLEEILKDIYQTWKENKENFGYCKVLSLNDKEKMKKKVMLKLINYKENKELLKEIPHRKFLDLAVVYYCVADMDEEETATFLVDNFYSAFLGMNEEELYCHACKNYLEQMPVIIKNLDDVILDLLKEEFGEEFLTGEIKDKGELYIITNERGFYGAVSILFLNEYRKYSDALEQDLYILPSSVHEILVLPILTDEKEELREMVQEVNRTEVVKEERLSDNVYRYYHKERIIKIV